MPPPPPHSDFDPTASYDAASNTITVSGPFDGIDEDADAAVVFAVVSQQEQSDDGRRSKAVTVTGEARLFRSAEDKEQWLIAQPAAAARPITAMLPGSTHELTYEMAPTEKWKYAARLQRGHRFRKGWAFGTAVLVSL